MDFLMSCLAWSGAALVIAALVIGMGVYLFGIGWLTGRDTRHRKPRHNTVTGW